MRCASEGCYNEASRLATTPTENVIIPLCAAQSCAPLAEASGFAVRLMPNRKRATS